MFGSRSARAGRRRPIDVPALAGTVTAMNTSHTTLRLPPTTVPSEEDASWLRRHTNRNLYDEQPERFEPTSAVDWLRVTDPAFTGGTMAWLDEVEDALLLINYEESHSHVAVLIEDVDCGLWVVLSSRRFRGRRS